MEKSALIEQVKKQLQCIPSQAVGISNIQIIQTEKDFLRCIAQRFGKYPVEFTAERTKAGKIKKTSKSITFYEANRY